MKYKVYIFLCFIFITLNIIAQENFTIIKTDISEYPKVKVYLQTEYEGVKKYDFKILELNKNKVFKFDTLPYSGFNQQKQIFLLTELIKNNDSAKSHYNEIRKSFKNLNSNDNINLGFFSNKDTVNYFSEYSSAEFSADFIFFNNILKNKHKQTELFSTAKPICDNMLSLLGFIKTKQLQKSNEALIVLINNLNYSNENYKCIYEIEKFQIPVYFITTNQIDTANENRLINISRLTGGIYTFSKTNKINDILKKYYEDISLRNNLSKENIYLISFKTDQTNKKNFFKIKYKEEEEKESFFEHIVEDSNIRNYKIYILILLFLFLGLLLWHVIFRRNYKIKAAAQFSSGSDKKIIDIELDNKFNDIAKPATIVLKTKDEIRNIKITAIGCVIGRNSDCEIIIKDDTVSAFHAEIKVKKGRYFITDLDSTNGTFVNGYRVNDSELKNNDLIKVGTALLKIKY